MKSLSASIDKATRNALGAGWADHGRLIAHWQDIVGKEFASHTSPLRLAFPPGRRTDGTLYIGVPQALAVQLQHENHTLILRINGFFGYSAIKKLSFTYKRVAQGWPTPEVRKLSPEERSVMARSVEAITESSLRETLASLGASLLAAR